MERCKELHAQPVVTGHGLYVLRYYMTRRGKLKFFITVIDSKGDLKICEVMKDHSLLDVKQRVKEIVFELVNG